MLKSLESRLALLILLNIYTVVTSQVSSDATEHAATTGTHNKMLFDTQSINHRGFITLLNIAFYNAALRHRYETTPRLEIVSDMVLCYSFAALAKLL